MAPDLREPVTLGRIGIGRGRTRCAQPQAVAVGIIGIPPPPPAPGPGGGGFTREPIERKAYLTLNCASTLDV